MSLENIENSAKNLVELAYNYERTNSKDTKKKIIQLSTNIKNMINKENEES